MIAMPRAYLLSVLLFSVLNAVAEIPSESYGQLTMETLPARGLLVNTFSARTILFDADTQQVLGMVSNGIGANAFEVDRDRGLMHTAETYLSRHTRGERTDVITTYELRTLSPISEITIASKHASGSPQRYYTGIVKNENVELMLVTNITPAVSVSVADVNSGKFLSEIATAGCGLVYPVEGLSFMQLCGDGSAQLITLNDKGEEQSRVRSKGFFDIQDDPLMEKPVRTDTGWIFNTFKGKLFQLAVRGKKIKVTSLFTVDDGNDGWRIGGMQPVAYHGPSNLLLLLMHQGGEGTHKDPGTQIWYINLDDGTTSHRLKLDTPANSILVSQDDEPLLYTSSIVQDQVHIYDLKTTVLQGVLSELGTPTILQNL